MVNTSRLQRYYRQKGAALLALVAVLLLAAAYLAIYTANFASINQKITSNYFRDQQAFEAAEAGIQYGINYLSANSTTILVASGGVVQPYSDSNTNNVALGNGCTYTITYSNPIVSNYSIILVTSVGKSADATATRTITQLVYGLQVLSNFPNVPILSRGNLAFSGNVDVTNTENNTTMIAGGSITAGGNFQTILASGVSSSAGNLKSDISANNASIAAMSPSQFFQNYFGESMSSVKATANTVYTNNTNTTYNSLLNGVTNKSIWIEQTAGTATINGNTVIGSPSNPVLLVVNGNLSVNGNTVIYGVVFVAGTGSLQGSGNATIHGAVITSGNASDAGNFSINYDSTIINRVKAQTGASFSPVPGGWSDI